jgi:hypothetical protein
MYVPTPSGLGQQGKSPGDCWLFEKDWPDHCTALADFYVLEHSAEKAVPPNREREVVGNPKSRVCFVSFPVRSTSWSTRQGEPCHHAAGNVGGEPAGSQARTETDLGISVQWQGLTITKVRPHPVQAPRKLQRRAAPPR